MQNEKLENIHSFSFSFDGVTNRPNILNNHEAKKRVERQTDR